MYVIWPQIALQKNSIYILLYPLSIFYIHSATIPKNKKVNSLIHGLIVVNDVCLYAQYWLLHDVGVACGAHR